MGFVVKVYEAFEEDEVKAKVLAEFVEKLEEAINNNQVATPQNLHVQQLTLTKEIEQLQSELIQKIEQVRAELLKEIEQVRLEGKEAELRLTREIEKVRAEV